MPWSTTKLAESDDFALAAGSQKRARVYSRSAWWRLVGALVSCEGSLDGVVLHLGTGPIPGWTPTGAEVQTAAQVFGSDGPGSVVIAAGGGTFSGGSRRLTVGWDGLAGTELVPEPIMYQPGQEFLAYLVNAAGAAGIAPRILLGWQEWL